MDCFSSHCKCQHTIATHENLGTSCHIQGSKIHQRTQSLLVKAMEVEIDLFECTVFTCRHSREDDCSSRWTVAFEWSSSLACKSVWFVLSVNCWPICHFIPNSFLKPFKAYLAPHLCSQSKTHLASLSSSQLKAYLAHGPFFQSKKHLTPHPWIYIWNFSQASA